LKYFAKLLPILIIIVSITGLIIGGLIFNRWDYSLRGLIIAVPSIIASIFLLFILRDPINNNEASVVFLKAHYPSYLMFILIYLLTIIVLFLNVNRFVYFILIAVLYFIIFFQIFSRKNCSNKTIIEIISVMINVIYGSTLVYPLFFSTTDILLHNTFSTITRLSGHVIPVDLDVSYAPFPLFHIFNAISSNILALSAQNTHFIIMCLVYVIVVLFLYKIFLILSKNEQISLLACLCFSVIPPVLIHGIEMITSITAFVGFVILLYLIFIAKERNSILFISLIFLITIFIILIHQVSIAQIALLFALFIVCEFILNKKRYFFTYQIAFLVISFVSYWFFRSQLFVDRLILQRTDLNYFDVGQRQPILTDTSLDQMHVALNYVLTQINIGIFIFFALIGIGYILYRQKPNYLPVIAIFSLIVFIFFVPNPLFTSQTITNIYRVDRFWILLSPFMAFMMAYGMVSLGKWIQKRQKLTYSLISILFIIFILLSLQNPILTNTSKEGRLYFNNGELNGFHFITEKIPYGSKLFSDYQTARFFHLDYFSLTEKLKLPYYNSIILSDLKWSPKDDQYIIFRNSKFNDRRILLKSKGEFVNYMSNEENIRELEYFYSVNNNIYSSNQISVIIGNFN